MKITKVDNGKFKTSIKQNIRQTPIQTQSDKYLFDRNKTIGFRKDKKLFKFVGIRNGYSKQLEFSVKSVIIDGVEKIASNRVNFNDIILDNDSIIHSINNLNFYNKIDLTNYKNLVKIEEDFSDIDILYEVHIKGIKIKENSYYSNGVFNYRQNNLGQFLLLDEGNDNILFKIENPIAYDDNDKIYNIITHKLYKQDNIIYYKKSILNKQLTNLPLYIDANITFNSISFGNVMDYSFNDDASTSWNDAYYGNGVLSLNTNSGTTTSFQQYTSNLVNSWTSVGLWADFTTSVSQPWYITSAESNIPNLVAYTNTFSVTPSQVMTIKATYTKLNIHTNIPDFSIREYESTGTTTYIETFYNITSSGTFTWNHLLSTGTTSALLYLKSVPVGHVEFSLNVEFHKFGVSGTTYYDSYIERQFINFDTSNLYKIAITNMSLTFNLSSGSGEYAIQKSNTNNDYSISTLDYNSFVGTRYNTFVAIPGSQTIDLGQNIIDNFTDNSITKLIIRDNNYDYGNVTPTPPTYTNTLTHNWSYQLDVELTSFKLTGDTTISFPLDSNGFGVIYSEGLTYNDAYSGLTSTYIVHNSVSGTYSSGATYEYDLINHYMYRTFLNFNTSILDIYVNYIIKSAKLVIENFENSDDISIFQGTQNTTSGLTTTEFMNFGDFYTNIESITPNTTVSVELNGDIVNKSGDTTFVIRNKDYDYGGNPFPVGLVHSTFGFDFSQTYFQVELEPYKIDGLEYIQVKKGQSIDLYASRNTTEGEIYWASNSGITDILGSGNTLTINTIYYDSGDYIYAAILDLSGNTISYNMLSIFLDIYTLEYNDLPERNFNVHDVDIDSVYFKYHQCLSGVTYAYARELDDVYEQNMAVSDGEGLGSYNMYNEFDIIDEFFSNSHETEVVARMEEIDLAVSYKRINDVYIHEGTRVLIYSTPPSENDGVYVADFNLKLHKTDELSTADEAFRYKAHINAGDYLDYEFHTIYYTSSGTTSDYDFNYLDGNIYGDDVIDFVVYSEILFDANLFT